MPQPQQDEEEEPEMNVLVSQQGGQAGTTRGKIIADYNLDLDYEPEGSDPNIKLVDEEETLMQNRQKWN